MGEFDAGRGLFGKLLVSIPKACPAAEVSCLSCEMLNEQPPCVRGSTCGRYSAERLEGRMRACSGRRAQNVRFCECPFSLALGASRDARAILYVWAKQHCGDDARRLVATGFVFITVHEPRYECSIVCSPQVSTHTKCAMRVCSTRRCITPCRLRNRSCFLVSMPLLTRVVASIEECARKV